MQGGIGAKDQKNAQLELLLAQMNNSTDTQNVSELTQDPSDNEKVTIDIVEDSAKQKKHKSTEELFSGDDMSI